MPTLSGCTVVRNCLRNKYPFEASLATYLPICDEVVISYDPTSEDGTAEYLSSLARQIPKLKLVASPWNLQNTQSGSEIAIQSNVAIEACSSDWILYVQADEAIHEGDHAALLRFLEEPNCLAALFERRSFMLSLDREIPQHFSRGLLRLFRKGTCFAVGDAISCAPVQAARGQVVQTKWRMFNYCRVGRKSEILERCRGRESFYSATEGELNEKVAKECLEGGARYDPAMHPVAMRQWYSSEREAGSETFVSRPSKVSLSVVVRDGTGSRAPALLWQFRGWAGDVVLVDDGTTDGSIEVFAEGAQRILGAGDGRVKVVKRAHRQQHPRAVAHSSSQTEWLLHVAPEETWDSSLAGGIEALTSQLEKDGKTVCGFAKANFRSGRLVNDAGDSKDVPPPPWPPVNRDVQFRLLRRAEAWAEAEISHPLRVIQGDIENKSVVLQDYWILSDSSDQEQRPNTLPSGNRPVETEPKDRCAILVMMAPGCEPAIDRQVERLSRYRGEADIFASLDGVNLSLPKFINPLHPPEGAPGIVRPTKWCVEELAKNGLYRRILRLTWDAELIMPLAFAKRARTVYGSMRWNPDGRVQAHLHRMGVDPARVERMYVDGFAMLAPVEWWKDIYCSLPEEITHYCDDAVACNIGELRGFELCHLPLANHRHFEWRIPSVEVHA